jgi:nucleotide-binding universal stress UspA family protein
MAEDHLEPPSAQPEPAPPAMPGAARERVFLVVVDETAEMQNALHFAIRRARSTDGRVALLYVIEPAEFQHWLGVERVMQEEARQQAEQTLQALAAKVQAETGKLPILHVREGRRNEELLALIEEDPSIQLLVLGTATGREGPGPLVTYLVSQMGNQMRVPVTLVPGQLTREEIDEVS